MLLDQRFALECLRANGYVEMVHRAGPVVDAHLSVGQSVDDEAGQCLVVDHDFKRGEPALSASAKLRASPRVSGRRLAPLASAAVTPLAKMMPVTPTRMAGTPLARNGPTSIVNDRCRRAIPRKIARSTRARLFISALLRRIEPEGLVAAPARLTWGPNEAWPRLPKEAPISRRSPESCA